jgi:cell volume regulation protein A
LSIEELDLALLLGAAVLLVGVFAVRLSLRTGLPSLLLYLGLGLLIGEDGIGLRFDDAELTGVLGYAALMLILTEGGITTRWDDIRDAVAPAAVLATVGTAVSIAVTGAAAHWLLSLSWPVALLTGAIVSSTDAAAVFSVLRRVPLPGRLAGMLEAESGFNDAPVVIAVVALTAQAGGQAGHSPVVLLAEAGWELLVGAAVGLGVGRLGASALRRIALPSSGLYPLAVLGLTTFAYGLATQVHGSGFLAVYLAALVLGNSRLPHRAAVRGFAEGLGWIAQIGLFVLLGLLADPTRLGRMIGPAVLLGLVLLLVARPLSVLLSVSWFRVGWRQQAFLSWAGLRGAVPVVLATIPMAAGLPDSERLFDAVFVLVVVFTLLQAPTMPWLARRLKVANPLEAVELDVESSPLGALGADVLQVHVGESSRLHGVEAFELRLPPGANVTLVIRAGESFVPEGRTMLRHGDDLIVVVPSSVRRATEQRLRDISAGGKLARWYLPEASRAGRPGMRRVTWYDVRARRSQNGNRDALRE